MTSASMNEVEMCRMKPGDNENRLGDGKKAIPELVTSTEGDHEICCRVTR